jgi:oxygen-independent coproporphyrinogen-3 oxidase
MAPDSVTIYQMELPYNTTISKNLLAGGEGLSGSVANWVTKRRWVEEAFEALEKAGYIIGSAYTAVKDASTRFVYRDRLWQGADMVGLGVASFGYVNGVHMQNVDTFEEYCSQIAAGTLPLGRALRPTADERLIREFVLQLKLGFVRPAYFAAKYGADVLARFHDQLETYAGEGLLTISDDRITLTREGLLRVDSLLPRFFNPEHQSVRYS